MLLAALWAIVKIFLFIATVAIGVTLFVRSREVLKDQPEDLYGDPWQYSRSRD